MTTLQKRLTGIKRVILVLSGKGGVGKSSVSSLLALSLAHQGHKVGLLDIDLCGPSIPTMLGVRGRQIFQSSDGWVPVYLNNEQNLAIMSIGFLLKNQDDAVVWRGPKKTAMIKQFLADVVWGPLDYLIVDTPPGTTDEHITIVECLQGLLSSDNAETSAPVGTVLVTTPQAVALSDVRKELTFCRQVGVPVIGIVENMSGFVCPHCSECSNLFSSGGGESFAKEYGVPFLGRIPIDPQLTASLETGNNFITAFPDSGTRQSVTQITQHVLSSFA